MKAAELAERFTRGPVTELRITKLRAACERFAIPYDDVLALLPADIRDQVTQTQAA